MPGMPAQSTRNAGHSKMSLVHHYSSGTSTLTGRREGGRNGEEKIAYNLRDIQRAFLPRGLSAVWAPGLSRDQYNPAG